MTELPDPLTPSDCNLRGLPFMPLMVTQVIQSETFGLSTGDEFKAAFALWCASWLEVPAGSLPSDDRMLDYLSKAKVWKKVRDVALRGWVLCSDGRLYHPVICERALEAWDKRTVYRDKEDTKSARQQRWREQCKHLAEQLRAQGVTPPKGASLELLKRLLSERGVDTQASTFVDTETSTGDAGEMPKREKREGEGELTTKAVSGGSTDSDREDDIDRLPRRPQHGAANPDMRAVAIATLLTGAGVKRVTAFHPDVATTWAQDERVTDELLLAAVSKARDSLGTEPFQTAYLRPIVVDLLNPPAPKVVKTNDWAWKRTNPGIEAKGRELGMRARGTESYPDFAERIQQELDKRKGAAA